MNLLNPYALGPPPAPPVPVFAVSGASITAVNGDYFETAVFGSQPTYTNSSGIVAWESASGSFHFWHFGYDTSSTLYQSGGGSVTSVPPNGIYLGSPTSETCTVTAY